MTPPSGDYRDGPLRPFVLTGGRARPSRNTIGVDTLLIVVDPQKALPISASRQERALVGLCRKLLSVVEASAHLKLPASVVAVLASDLVDSGHLSARMPASEAQPERELLVEVLDGLRRLR